MRKTKLFSLVAAALLTATTAWADVAVNGKLPGAFSVSATKVVYFSQGNLQYQGSTGSWRFAENQYDFIGKAAGNITSSNRDKSTYWIDLFGWATSGWNNSNRNAYQPYSTSTTNSDYGVKSTKAADETLTGDYANGDWGVYNSASLGSGWRTLTNAEWGYLFNTRTTSGTVNSTSNARYTEAKILTDGTGTNYLTYNICGIILFPDDFDGGVSYGSEGDVTWGTINGTSAWGTTCTTAGWAALEDAGCVFLPAAGRRDGTTVGFAGSGGYYWSSTAQSATNAYNLYFCSSYVNLQNNYSRCFGFSVRLVQDIPAASLTSAPTAKSLTYNGSAQALVNAGTASGGTMNYSLDNSTWSTSIPTATNADDYTVYYKVVGDASHTDYTPSPNTVAVTISKAALSITADNKSVTYGDAAPTYTANYSGFVGSETASVLSGTLAFACEYSAGSNVGGYTITPSGVTASNYDITFNTGTLTVNKADAVITDTPAAIEGLVYTGATQTLINAGTASGGELQYKLDDGAYGTSLPQATDADTYTVYYKVVGDDNHNDVAETSFTVTIGGPTDQVLTANQDPNRTSDYYSTFYHSTIQYSLPEGTQAYIATLDGDALNLTKIAEGGDVLPADNAVILKASGSSITLTPSDEAPVTFDVTNNLLGVNAATAAPSNCYVLSGHSSDNSVTGVGFYQFTGTLAAHKAYVVIGGGGSMAPKRLRFVFNETNTATDIDQVQSDKVQSTKVLRDGQLIIIRGDKEYNAQGQIVK